MNDILIILIVTGWLSGWVCYVVLLKIWHLAEAAQAEVRRLQEQRHVVDEMQKAALGQHLAGQDRVIRAMAEELHRLGFRPPEGDEADWWKRGDKPPGS